MGLVLKHYIRTISEPAPAAGIAGRSVALLPLDLNEAKLCKMTLWKLLGDGSNICLLYGNSSRIPGKQGRLAPGEQPLIVGGWGGVIFYPCHRSQQCSFDRIVGISSEITLVCICAC